MNTKRKEKKLHYFSDNLAKPKAWRLERKSPFEPPQAKRQKPKAKAKAERQRQTSRPADQHKEDFKMYEYSDEEANISNLQILLHHVARSSPYDYNENWNDLESLAVYLHDNGTTASALYGIPELSAFHKVKNEDYKAEDYPPDQWEEIEHADILITYDYKLFYSLKG